MYNALVRPLSIRRIAGAPAWRVAMGSALLAGCQEPAGSRSDDPRPDEPGEIASAEATVHTISQATLTVELGAPGRVAAACIARQDPADVHLVEAEATPAAELRFAGLLPSTDYDCKIAPTSDEGPPAAVSFRTNDPPEGVSLASADAAFAPGAEMTGTYTVMNVKPECRSDKGRNYIAVLDPDGNNRWRHDLPYGMNIGVEVAPDGPNRFLWGGGKSGKGAPEIVDVHEGTVWKLTFPGSDQIQYHHDARRIADGRILSVEEHDDPGWLSTRLRLVDEDNETTWTWDMQRAVETGWLPPGDSGEFYDPHHVNWAHVVDSGDGPVAYLSLCFSELIMAVDVATGEVLWDFGDGGEFTLVDPSGAPLDDDFFPQCQHGLQVEGDRMLVYDNGFDREYSRAVEYELDVENMVAVQTWEWLDDGFFERYHGGVDWLTADHSRVLVTEATNNCLPDERHAQIVEVDRSRDDLVVHRLTLHEVSDWIYRAHRVDGCDLFANTRYCPDLAARFEALRPALGL